MVRPHLPATPGPTLSAARVLVVCHANVARSVAAAYLITAALGDRAAEVEVHSAGTHATEGQHVSARTESALAAVLGAPVGLSQHRARQLTGRDVEGADLVIAMEASQVRALRRGHAQAAGKVATLGLLARELPVGGDLHARVAAMSLAEREPDDLDDVVDPAGGDDAAYEATMAILAAWCGRLAPRLVE
jgi:protein-tyrosine phosphatase